MSIAGNEEEGKREQPGLLHVVIISGIVGENFQIPISNFQIIFNDQLSSPDDWDLKIDHSLEIGD